MIDKQELRRLASACLQIQPTLSSLSDYQTFKANVTPQAVIALLDELEACKAELSGLRQPTIGSRQLGCFVCGGIHGGLPCPRMNPMADGG